MAIGNLRRFGQSLLDCVNEIARIGEFRSVVKKDYTDLSRRIVLLSHLFEEIRDFNGGPVPENVVSSLGALLLAIQASKHLLQLGRSGSKILLVLEGMRIAVQFQYVTCQLEKVLRVLPLDYFEISDEVREQVELVLSQLRRARARERNGSSNAISFTDNWRVTSRSHGKDVETQGSSSVICRLGVEDICNFNHKFEEFLVQGVEGKVTSDQNSQQMKYVLERLKNPAASYHHEANESGAKAGNLASKSLEENWKADPVLIPDDFRCPISLELMRDPVVVATGQTYERSFIQRWIDRGNRTCPKTQQKLPHLILTPNYSMKSLITQWCETHGIEQPERSTQSRIRKGDGSFHEIYGDRAAIDALVRKLSSRLHEEQRSAAAEIRLLAKRSTDNRVLIAEAGAIPILINLLSIGDFRTQEHAVTAILNLSIYGNNKALIVLAGAIPLIVEVLRLGSMEARENAAATLFSLSLVDENKITIGASGAISALVDLLCSGSPRGKKDAATALFNLCIYQANKSRAVRARILVPLMMMLTDPNNGMVDEALTIMSVLASHQEGKVAIAKANAIPLLVDLVRTGLPRNKENATAILLALCKKDRENLARVGRLGAFRPLTELVKSGTERAKRKATSLLEHMGRWRQL